MRIVSETSEEIFDEVIFELKCFLPEVEEEKTEYEKKIEEIVAKTFPTMRKVIVNQVQEVHRVPYKTNPKRNMQKQTNILIKQNKHK